MLDALAQAGRGFVGRDLDDPAPCRRHDRTRDERYARLGRARRRKCGGHGALGPAGEAAGLPLWRMLGAGGLTDRGGVAVYASGGLYRDGVDGRGPRDGDAGLSRGRLHGSQDEDWRAPSQRRSRPRRRGAGGDRRRRDPVGGRGEPASGRGRGGHLSRARRVGRTSGPGAARVRRSRHHGAHPARRASP